MRQLSSLGEAEAAGFSSSSAEMSQIVVASPLDLRRIEIDSETLKLLTDFDRSVRSFSNLLIQAPSDVDAQTISRALNGWNIRLFKGQVASKASLRLLQEYKETEELGKARAALGSATLVASLSPAALCDFVDGSGGHGFYRSQAGSITPAGREAVTVFLHCDYEAALAELCEWINSHTGGMPTSLRAVLAYIQVLQLHAFPDGNGRLARNLASAILSAHLCASERPLFPITAFMYANDGLVMRHLKQFDTSRDVVPLARVILALFKGALCASLTISNEAGGMAQ